MQNSIIVKDIYLATRDSKGKVRTVLVELHQDGNTFTIKRFTGQLGGKIIEQPHIIIDAGKAKRTILQQAELQYNAKVKEYCNKGYKKISELTKKKVSDLTNADIEKLIPEEKTDSNGVPKPMLAKQAEKVAVSNFEKPHWCSRKLDGGSNAVLKFD